MSEDEKGSKKIPTKVDEDVLKSRCDRRVARNENFSILFPLFATLALHILFYLHHQRVLALTERELSSNYLIFVVFSINNNFVTDD